MFSSRTLADRNNDPYPNVWDGHSPRDQMRSDTDMFRKGAPSSLKGYSRKPRPEFQHGVLPENPILVAFREKNLDLSWFLNEYNHPTDYWVWEYGVEEVDHAHRVLTLVSKLGANQ